MISAYTQDENPQVVIVDTLPVDFVPVGVL